jgi:hypothetical protein
VRKTRYVGLEFGIHGFKPYKVDRVLARRFGDCKDKTLLLVTLLRALGVEAWPALVNTERGQALDAMHPSPGVFDHVIVRARLDGREYWLDPTSSHERGPLEAFEPPPFRRALPIDDATTALVEIPEPQRLAATMEVEETYVESAAGQPVSLTVTTRWLGPGANDMRRQLSTSSLKDLEREYLNFYARTDPRIRSTAPLSVTDDPERNVLTLVERYAIDSFWLEGRRDFAASNVSSYLTRPRIAQRTMPLEISHPVNVRQRIRVEMLRPIRIEHEMDSIQGPASTLDYSYWTEAGGKVLLLEYRYRSLKDAVEPARFMEHLETLKRMELNTGYQVTLDKSLSGGGGRGPRKGDLSGASLAMVLGVLFTLGLLLMLMNDGPRAFLRDLRARRRKQAFSRKFDPDAGESAAQSIPLASVDELPARLSRVRCVCGVAGAEAPKLEEILLGEQHLVLAKWTCPNCDRARHAYFSVKEARAA